MSGVRRHKPRKPRKRHRPCKSDIFVFSLWYGVLLLIERSQKAGIIYYWHIEPSSGFFYVMGNEIIQPNYHVLLLDYFSLSPLFPGSVTCFHIHPIRWGVYAAARNHSNTSGIEGLRLFTKNYTVSTFITLGWQLFVENNNFVERFLLLHERYGLRHCTGSKKWESAFLWTLSGKAKVSFGTF